jgi:predicted RNA-binding Zn ribbon-like protein
MTDRTRAPAELEQIAAFVNTVDLEAGRDDLAEPEALAAWLAARGLAPAELRVRKVDLRRAIELREALRAVLLAHTDGQKVPTRAAQILEAAAWRARIRLGFLTDGQTRLEPTAGGVDAALGRLLAIVHDAIADGSWTRLKACREHTCAWAFYDHTRNHSRAWCDMQVCGNRAKARAYRRRHAQ